MQNRWLFKIQYRNCVLEYICIILLLIIINVSFMYYINFPVYLFIDLLPFTL